ncbi:MAG: RloB family protein [Opitutae bacterium]|nr:RloB family protein [Opitutae bacterium]
MAKDKYKRKAEKSARSFLRTIGRGASPGSSILVVTEGENTEPIYFEGIRKVFASSAIELVPYGAGRGDPRTLTEAAIRYRNKRRKQARNKELSISQLEDFDQIWIVFDTDVLTPERRDQGIAYAESKGVKVASSEPCFEYWLLLHSAEYYTTAPMPKCDDVKPYLKKAFGWLGYDKNKSQSQKLILPLVTKSNVAEAVRAAARVRKHHEAVDTPFPANPSTDVDLLINAINEAVAIANKVAASR